MKKAQFFTFTLLFISICFPPIRLATAQSTNANSMVRLIYFLPNDRPARPDRVQALRQLIKDAQEFYADEMQRHGFGRKTFTVETDKDGEPVVHQVHGKFNTNYYYNRFTGVEVWKEFFEHTEDLQHIYFFAIDLGRERLSSGNVCGTAHVNYFPSSADNAGNVLLPGTLSMRYFNETQGEEALGGAAAIPASGSSCFEGLGLTLHELGHAFGLHHDFREGIHSDYVMAYGGSNRLSQCAAEWLSVSRFFNSNPMPNNSSGTIQLISKPRYSSDGISIRFKVTDTDGLHQAQLLGADLSKVLGMKDYKLFDYKQLNSKTSTIEFISRTLTTEPVDNIQLQIIDINGGITWMNFLTDIASLLPPPKVVSIPDPNLAKVVRTQLGIPPRTPITDRAMQRLTRLDARDKKIKSLTGLEHATQLTGLFLYNNQIRDVSPLAKLTQLRKLGLDGNQISNIRPLSGLTQLELLHIGRNKINNARVRLLTPLKQLKWLSLHENQIGNITPLAKLTKLEGLWLSSNKIRDVSPLAGLVNLETLHLRGNPIHDFSALSNLTNLSDVDFSLSEAGIGSTTAGPKIEGPWLWMIVSTGRKGGKAAASLGKDYLAAATKGSVTEQQIAANGATAGERIKNRAWTWGRLAPTGGDNITETVRSIGLTKSNTIDNHVAYGSIALRSPRKQKTKMYVGSDDAVKVWFNGKLVHDNPIDRAAEDYQDSFPITLKKGKNILLVAVYDRIDTWSGFFGFEEDAAYSLITPRTPMNRSLAAPRSPNPNQTSLFTNYPNPFNPETWMPYRLAKSGDVRITIYNTRGIVVRQLELGHQQPGYYTSRSRAAYWDGRNQVGESVASGLYLYTLTADDFTATGKMLIRK